MTSQRSQAHLRDERSQFHPFTSINDLEADGPMMIESGSGVRVRDIQGKEYIDGMAGLWCVNLGYGRKEISEAITRQSEKLAFFHTFNGLGTDVVGECAEALLRFPCRVSFSEHRAAMLTKRNSRSSGFTIICVESRKRKRSYLAGMPIMARASQLPV